MSLEANVSKVLQLLASDLEHARLGKANGVKRPPFILGVTGLQGSGKSTWASAIVKLLPSRYGLEAIQVSLDDFYHKHDRLVEIREANTTNQMLRTRGQPGTHDENLASAFFRRLRQRESGLTIPVFEKSMHNGEGDRLPETQWPTVPDSVDVVVFEGWCVGFQPLTQSQVASKQQAAQTEMKSEDPNAASTVTLSDHSLEHLLAVNDNLGRYCEAFMGPQHFDSLIHLDTDVLSNVYGWRLEQEHALAKAKGSGMSDEEVIKFVRGYMPAYELYLESLRRGFFSSLGREARGKDHIRVLLGRQREILGVTQLSR